MVFDPQLVGDHIPLSIHREEIKQVSSYRYLGIHIDNLFSWSDHIDYVCSIYSKGCIFYADWGYLVSARTSCFYFIMQWWRVSSGMGWRCGSAISAHSLNLNYSTWYRLLWRWWGGLTSSPFKSIYEQSVLRQAWRVLSEASHIFQTEYELLPVSQVCMWTKCMPLAVICIFMCVYCLLGQLLLCTTHFESMKFSPRGQ